MGKVMVKQETCQVCGATSVENLIRIEDGHPMKIYVRCGKCKTFVARYIVSTYTSDMTYEALLKILRTTQLYCFDCRGSSRELEGFSEHVRQEFEKTEKQVQTQPERRLIVEILEEEKKPERGKKDDESDSTKP